MISLYPRSFLLHVYVVRAYLRPFAAILAIFFIPYLARPIAAARPDGFFTPLVASFSSKAANRFPDPIFALEAGSDLPPFKLTALSF